MLAGLPMPSPGRLINAVSTGKPPHDPSGPHDRQGRQID